MKKDSLKQEEVAETVQNANDVEVKESQMTEKDIVVARMRQSMAMTGRGGQRPSKAGSNRSNSKMTTADTVRAGAYYQKFVDIFYEMTTEEMKELVSEDGTKIHYDGKRVTGSGISAFQDAFQRKSQEEMEAKKEEAKLKAEADQKEIEDKDSNLKIKAPKAKKKATPKPKQAKAPKASSAKGKTTKTRKKV